MKILNLINQNCSDIKYKIQKFPDRQQNIIIDKDTCYGNKYGYLLMSHKDCIVKIKSRLNNWLDLELINCTVAALRELGVEEIHLYVPYIIGARSDRKFEEGGNNYVKHVIAPAINYLNFKSVICVDPHSDVLEACINNFRKESNLGLVTYFLTEEYPIDKKDNYIFISPDAGASKKIYKLAEEIGYNGDIIICSKDRDTNGKLTKCIIPAFDLSKDVIIVDDICDGGYTFINIASKIKADRDVNNLNPRGKTYLIVTHGIFSKGFEELNKYFDGIYCTNSYGQLHSDETRDSWIGTTEEQYWSEIPKNLVKQLDIF